MGTNTRGLVSGYLLVAQIVFIVLFGVYVRYDPNHTGPINADLADEQASSNVEDAELYPMFQDVHVMMLIGFGFLMTFLKRHGFGSVGFNFLLTAYVIQWSLLLNGFFENIGKDSSIISLKLEKFLHAVGGGLVTGLCMSWTAFDRMEEAELYEDEIFWEVNDVGEYKKCESEEKVDDEKNELQTMA